MKTSGMRDGPWRDSGVDRSEEKADEAGGHWWRCDPGSNRNGPSG